jgi:hypothetical protein
MQFSTLRDAWGTSTFENEPQRVVAVKDPPDNGVVRVWTKEPHTVNVGRVDGGRIPQHGTMRRAQPMHVTCKIMLAKIYRTHGMEGVMRCMPLGVRYRLLPTVSTDQLVLVAAVAIALILLLR